MQTVQIAGSSSLDESKRKAAIEKILKLPTKSLENLSSLADSKKAQAYLDNPVKFATLKSFL